jgi:hypothetical protein
MRLAHAVLAVLILGGGAGWWLLGHPGYETGEQKMARIEAVKAAQAAAEPHVYRWRDANGVLQITDKPPKGRKFEEVKLQEDVNVIPMSEPAPETSQKK